MANLFVNSQTLLQFTKSLVKCAENLHVEVYDYDVMSWIKVNVRIGKTFL